MQNEMLSNYEKEVNDYMSVVRENMKLSENELENNHKRQKLFQKAWQYINKSLTAISYMELELCNESKVAQEDYNKKLRSLRIEINGYRTLLEKVIVDSDDLEMYEDDIIREDKRIEKKMLLGAENNGDGNDRQILGKFQKQLKNIIEKSKSTIGDIRSTGENMVTTDGNVVSMNDRITTGRSRRRNTKKIVNQVLCVVIIVLVVCIIIVSVIFFVLQPLLKNEKQNVE